MKIRQETALTYGDVLLLPAETLFNPSETPPDISSQLSTGINLDVPVVSAPMDTVTEAPMAEAMAQAGGIGIIHRYLTAEQQAKQVRTVAEQGHLVGAAIGTRIKGKNAEDWTRAEMLIDAGANILVIDTAHGYTDFALKTLEKLKKRHDDVQVMVGSIATKEAARRLIDSGADSLRVGMGPGAICTTRIVSGVGVPQLTAIMDVAKVARRYKVPVVADGGIEYSGDMVKAFAAGASTVMLGQLLARTQESAGDRDTFDREYVAANWPQLLVDGQETYQMKVYRGMGSLEAIAQSRETQKDGKDFHDQAHDEKVIVAEGVSGYVPLNGPVEGELAEWMQGVRQGLYYTGSKNLKQLHKNAEFIRVSPASQTESRSHGVLLPSGL